MRKIAITLTVIIGLGSAAVFFLIKRADEHHSAERREWKNRAVEAIKSDLADPDYLKRRFGKIPGASDGIYVTVEEWKISDTIICGDASWLAYRAHCHKEGAEVHDIFIAKGSDGKWYHSDYHFCVGMMMLESQPLSLAEFKHQYFLVEFDGVSDYALDPTWIPVGERRTSTP